MCYSKIEIPNFYECYRLRLDWNNLGNSIDTFVQLCNSLKSNSVLNTLNLSNNNLCQKCGFYLAEMLNINKCLKNIGKYSLIGSIVYV